MNLKILQACECEDELKVLEHDHGHVGFSVVVSPLLSEPFCHPVHLVAINSTIRLDLQLEDERSLDNALVAQPWHKDPHVVVD
jgi:hypothetical protein